MPALEHSPPDRLESIAKWIGTPAGRGRIVSHEPEFGVWREIKTFEADGSLSTRNVRLLKRLGAGLAGTVYLAEDDCGAQFVEKHFGAIPTGGRRRLGSRLAELIFAFFRQAPLSFRELPQAVVAMHLINRFVVAFSRERFGHIITPPLIYSRFDELTGGYAQAFAYVDGRPLRPWDETRRSRLPLLGEAGLFLHSMRVWRDFLAKELGFWGCARQVDPANPNSFGNLWVTPEQHVVLLDIVPGVPGFLEARYLWWGLTCGQLPPFADAIDFRRLERLLKAHPLPPGHDWQGDFELLRCATASWQDSEPRLWSSPLRWWKVLREPRVRSATRQALLTHLEAKGAISPWQARDFRESLSHAGTFPQIALHTLLKMAPLRLHRALTDGAYRREALRKLLREGWRWPGRLVLAIFRGAGRALRRVLAVFGNGALLLANRSLRAERFRVQVGGWIDEEDELGRLDEFDAARLRAALRDEGETADLAGLFVVHVVISGMKHSLLGPSGMWWGIALATGQWKWLLPVLVAPVGRVVAIILMGQWRHAGLLFFCALPDVGVLGAPLYLLRHHGELGGFMLRAMGRKIALKVPGYGERGSLCEMIGVAATQIFIVDPARMLPLVLLVAMIGLLKHWMVVSAVAGIAYLATVLWSLITRQRGVSPFGSRIFSRMEPSDLSTMPVWKMGLPDRE